MPIDHVTKTDLASGVSGEISYLELNRYSDLDSVVTKIGLSLQVYRALRPSQLIHNLAFHAACFCSLPIRGTPAI